MSMKLLSPSEAQKRARNDDALNAVRSKELSDEVNRKHVELAQMEEAGAKFLASQRARWALEDQEHLSYKLGLLKEIEGLEERKRIALIPIEEREKEAENKMQEAFAVLTRATEKEKYADTMASTFEKRFDEFAEQELELKDLRSALNRREAGVKAQEKHTAQYAEGVSKAGQLFLEKSHAKEHEQEQRANDLQAIQFGLDVRKIAQDDKERELNEREINLKSRYVALEEAEKYIKSQIKK